MTRGPAFSISMRSAAEDPFCINPAGPCQLPPHMILFSGNHELRDPHRNLGFFPRAENKSRIAEESAHNGQPFLPQIVRDLYDEQGDYHVR